LRRSRAHGRHFRRTPGGRVALRFLKKRAGIHRCAKCGRPLAGVGFGKLPKSSRRPNRPHGGYLCPRCSREELRRQVRAWW
jgi:large subunit ribosomal protein L34e